MSLICVMKFQTIFHAFIVASPVTKILRQLNELERDLKSKSGESSIKKGDYLGEQK